MGLGGRHNEDQQDEFMRHVHPIINIIISALMFAVAGTLVKVASQTTDLLSLVFWRNVFSFLCVIIAGALSGKLNFSSEKKKTHVLRALFTFLALISYFYSVAHTHLGNAVLLQQTSPIFVPLISLIVLKKISDRYVWYGIIIGFIGVGLTTGIGLSTLNKGDLAGIIAGFMGGAATVTIWLMSSTETPFKQMLYFSLYSLIFSITFIPWVWQSFDLSQVPYFIALGIVTTLAQYFLSSACSQAPTDKIISWSYTSVIFATLFGYLGWQENLSLTMLAGMLFIVLGATMSSRFSAARE